ncbi:MAG: glutamate synthase [Clostridiaceae bacterium]
MLIDAKNLDYAALNEVVRNTSEDCDIIGCLGQRFIGAGMSSGNITISGVPGNGLGAYLDGAKIEVKGNVQDAVGDTMNAGKIVVHGNIGDAAGYAMRGGTILVKGNAGYRAGIHMKAYKEKLPVMIIGGRAGSFLGEYQAGGIIIVLGLGDDGKEIVGNFPCTGMHGGKMFLRSDCKNIRFPDQVTVHKASEEEIVEIQQYITEYCNYFRCDYDFIMDAEFSVITPDSKNPYKQMYVEN